MSIKNYNTNPLKKILFITISLLFSLGITAQTISKTYTASNTVTVDGCGSYCVALPSINFSAADFPTGCIITDVNVDIRWAKTDGSCASPGTANSYHNETNFRINGPTGASAILVRPSAYTGTGTMSLITTKFDQSAGTQVGGVQPFAGTFRPNNGNLNVFNGTNPQGNWTLYAGDTAGGDPLCITSYTVHITAEPDMSISCPSNINVSTLPGACTAPVTYTAPSNPGCANQILLSEDFSLGASNSVWSSLQYTRVNNSCGANGNALQFNVNTGGNNRSRWAITHDYCLYPGATIAFRLYQDNSGSPPCDEPEGEEQLRLQYSTNGGGTWVNWIGPIPRNNAWTQHNYTIPAAAITGATRFRFLNYRADRQFDNASLDDIVITNGAPPSVVQTAGLPSGSNFPVGTTTNTFTLTDCDGNVSTCSFDVNVSVGAIPEPFGNNEWLVYGYNGNNYNQVYGVFNAGTNLNQNSQTQFPSGGSPSMAPSWSGCTVPNDQHSFRYKRRGFPCGTYQINILGHDDNSYLDINGTTVWFHNGCCDAHNNVWTGTLDENSEVLFGVREFGGGSNLNFEIIPISSGVSNDDCVDAIPVAVPSSSTGNTSNPCLSSETAPFCGTGDGSGAGVWYSFIGTGNVVQVSTCGSSYDTKIRVYTGNCGSLNCVAGSDDAGPCGVQTEFDFCTTLGQTYYVLVHGFSSSEGAYILNIDEFPANPTISCPANITVNNDNGVCGAVVNYTAPIGNDDCPGQSTTQIAGLASGATFPVGTTTNTFRVTDAAGNTATCSFTVTVVDNEPPTFNCSPNITVNTAPGQCQAVVNYPTPTISDNCIGQTIINETFTGGANPAYWNNIVLGQVNSGCGSPNGDALQFNLNGGGNANRYAETIDFCLSGTTTVSFDLYQQTSGNPPCDEPEGGEQLRVQYSTNGGGSWTTFAGPITRNGAWTSYSFTLPAAAQTNATRIRFLQQGADSQFDNASLDNVIITLEPNLTAGFPSGGTFPIGTTTNTFEFQDCNGATATCSFTVTVNDNEAPNASCTNYTANLGGGGTVTITPANINGGSTDNCNIASMSVSPNTFDCSHVGTTQTVTLTVTDDAGNPSTCTSNVTITDTNSECCDISLDNIVKTDEVCPNENDGTITITASCTSCASIEYSIGGAFQAGNSFTGLSDGTYNIIIRDTAKPDCNDTGTITINPGVDNTNPTITCPANITVNNDSGICGAVVNYTAPSGSDNCLGQSTAQIAGLTSGSTFPVGTTTNTFRVTDASGNTTTCSFTVTVNDNAAPTITCPANITQNTNLGECGADITIPVPTFNDNCAYNNLALNFDGTNDAVTLPDFPVYNQSNSSNRTVEVWFRVNDKSINTRKQAIYEEGGAGNGLNIYIYNGFLYCGIWSDVNGWKTYVNTNAILDDTWHHVALVLDGASETRAYLDGTLFATDNTAGVLSPHSDNNSIGNITQNTEFHDGDFVGNGHHFEGDIDELRLWNDVRTLQEIIDNRHNDVAGAANLVYYYNFNQAGATACEVNTGQTTLTATAGGLNGALNNFDLSGNFSGANDPCSSNWTIAGLNITNDRTSSQSASDTYPVGTTTVTWTATDGAGNTATCSMDVTVNDTEPPAPSCATITVQLDATGNVSITPADIGSGSQDNCAVTSMTLNISDFTCAQIGNNTVTLTAFDAAGNSATCQGTVIVEDNQAPTITCPVNVSVDTDPNECYAVITYAAPTASDNCPSGLVITQTSGLPSGSQFPVGTTTNIFEVTDGAGNTGTCSFTITVTDNEAPTLVCQDATIILDASGLGSISNATQVTTSFGDACGFGNLSYSQSAFDCSHAGMTIPVTVTATDVNGNTSTCVSNVTIVDNINPMAVCQNITVQLDASGSVTVADNAVDGGSTDNCTAPLTYSISQNTFGCANIGANIVILTVTDAAGNTDNCTATITVEDNVNPVAICQNITVQLNAAGTATIVAGDVDGGSTDACGTPSLSIDVNSFDCSNIGTNIVTLTATDGQGNTDDCTANVTVEDNIPPTVVCQNITVQLDALGNATITASQIDNGSSDACGIASVSVNQTTFDCSHIGVNNVVLTVTDNNGNSATCPATVTVVDDVNPTAICQNITVQLDASGNATIAEDAVNNGSSDACGGLTYDTNITTFDCTNVGANTVTLTVTDGNGNTATCTATVTVEDNVAPVATCQNITIQLDASGNATIAEDAVNNGSSDACGGLTYDTDITAFDCNDLGANTVTLTVTDDNGNTATCTATVTVEDNVNPIAVCQNITVQLDASGNVTIAEDAVNNGSSDACGNLTFDTDITSFDCSSVGPNNVVMTVTDGSGNTATCSAVVTVEDNTIPNAVCQNITIQLDASGNATIAEDAVNNGSSDACGGLTFDTDVTTFGCGDVGANTVVLTVTDGNGNSATCSATVTVEDNVPPTALCQNVTVQLDAAGNASITTADIDNGSGDNCANVSLSLDNSSFDCSNVGTNTVTLTVTDDNSNSTTCQATVTVEDNVPPTAICQNVLVQLDAAGNASITTADIDNGSNDACGIASLALDNTSFDCTNVGANTVTLTVTDNNGNTSTCTATVTVQDNVNPTAVCQNVTVQLDAAGMASITTGDIDDGSNDACGIASLALNQTTFDCNDVGANTVTLTVTDNNGNVSTCTATVTVEDNINPSAVCQDIIVQLDASGNATIVAADVDNGSADNCGPVSLAIDVSSFDCTDIGPNTVTLTVTDANTNTFTCQSIATVEDNVPPTAICQDITVQLDATGNVSITEADIDNGSNDACGIASLALNITSFDCTDVGANTVSLTVTDNNGNTSICTATVTVEDNVNPTAICQDITVQLDATGNATISATDVDNGSNDNCNIASRVLDITTFDCTDIGTNTVTMTVTDENGNVATCTANVTIEDNVNPMAVCQDLVLQLDAAGNASITPAQVDNGSSDACSTPNLALDITTFDCTDVGANVVTLTATDANGNSSICTATITVQDDIDPVLTNCPADITQLPNTTGCESIVDWTPPTTSDNCPGSVLTSTHNPMNAFPLGTTTVTYTLTDASGNVVTCSFDVTISGTNASVDINVIEANGTNDGNICTGDEVTLDAGVGYSSYIWSNGSTAQSITTSSPGVYIVTVSNGFGCTASDSETVTELGVPIASLDCPDPALNECQGRFNCMPNDLNSSTLPVVTGTFSGTAAPYIIGSGAPGSDTFIDFVNMPKDVELELIYTVSTPDGCSDSTSCTFTVASKKANPGRF